MARMIRMAFRAITTDVNGLHPGHSLKIDKINLATVRRAQRAQQKLTQAFRHGQPRFRLDTGLGQPPDAGGSETGRSMAPHGMRARWAASYTDNDPIYFYLNSGARRFRHMSHDWQSMTRAGRGNARFPRAGTAAALSRVQVGYIEPRYFNVHAIMMQQRIYERDIRKVFGNDAIYRFFGKVNRR